MRSNPCRRFRPARIPDGQGGWLAADWCADPVLVYGWVKVRNFDTLFLARAEEDLQQEDVLEIDGRFWRILLKTFYTGGPVAAWKIEMCDRPQVAAPGTTTGG